MNRFEGGAVLASDDTAYVTETNLLTDGGRTAVMQDSTVPDYQIK